MRAFTYINRLSAHSKPFHPKILLLYSHINAQTYEMSVRPYHIFCCCMYLWIKFANKFKLKPNQNQLKPNQNQSVVDLMDFMGFQEPQYDDSDHFMTAVKWCVVFPALNLSVCLCISRLVYTIWWWTGRQSARRTIGRTENK